MATAYPNAQAFIAAMTPYVQQAAKTTGLAPALIMAQWGNETGWGTSHAFTANNNVAGVGVTSTTAVGGQWGSVAQGVQGYINFINDNSRYTAVKKAGTTAVVQAKALGASGYAKGQYTNGGGPGSDLITIMKTVSGVSALGGTATQAAIGAAGTGGTAIPPAAGGVAAPSTTQPASTIGPGAIATIETVLKKAHLTTLAPWASGLVTQLAAKGDSQSTIVQTLTVQLYTQPAFKKQFPGMTARKANGYGAMSIAEYLTYEDQAKQMGRAAGLPTGFLSTTEIGQLIGNDVSPSELSDRLTKGYEVASQAPQETKNLLNQYYGINTGTLAAYYLTPKKAEPTLVNQLTAAQIGTEGVSSGFGALGKTQAQYLQQMGVDQSTARSTFKGLSKLTPLMSALPGTGGEKTSISQSDLVNYGFFGTNQNELQAVEGARKAPFEGGGGYVQSAKGVLGAGFGNSEGQVGT